MRWSVWFLILVLVLPLGVTAVSSAEVQAVSDTSANNSYNEGVIELVPGWNLVGIPRRLNEQMNRAAIFAGVNSSGRSIWTYDMSSGGWRNVTAEDVVYPLDGYFIYSTTARKIPLTYSADPLQVPPVKDLMAGWNLVGFSGSFNASARDALLSIRKSWTQVIGWDPVRQNTEDSIINSGNGTYTDTRELMPMKAYWVYVENECSLASIGA
jgi:hypothetical protein